MIDDGGSGALNRLFMTASQARVRHEPEHLLLRRRDDLTLWLDQAALAGWAAPRRTTPGGQPRYSDLAVELVLILRLVFHLALRQAEAGLGVDATCRKLGISQATFFRWKAKYGDLGTPEVRRLRQLEEENLKLKQLVADLSLDKKMLQDVLAKKP